MGFSRMEAMGMEACLPGRRQHIHAYRGWSSRFAIDPLGGLAEILRSGVIDVAERLRISVHKREPTALHLHHDAVTASKRVISVGHHPLDLCHLPRFERL